MEVAHSLGDWTRLLFPATASIEIMVSIGSENSKVLIPEPAEVNSSVPRQRFSGSETLVPSQVVKLIIRFDRSLLAGSLVFDQSVFIGKSSSKQKPTI